MSWISDISTEMKQNSTKNMMLRHLKVIKAKIEQKSIHNASYVCTPSDLFSSFLGSGPEGDDVL